MGSMYSMEIKVIGYVLAAWFLLQASSGINMNGVAFQTSVLDTAIVDVAAGETCLYLWRGNVIFNNIWDFSFIQVERKGNISLLNGLSFTRLF